VGRLHRRYTLALSQCGGGSGMRVGFVYDPAKLTVEALREFPELDPRGEGACTRGERPGLLARFSSPAGPFALLAVHLAAHGDEEFARKRRAQWRRAIEIVKSLDVPAAILGDTNSTGWLDDRWGERSFIEAELRRAKMQLITGALGCSEYWQRDGRLVPSLLDHVAATAGFPARTAALHGFCARLECREIDADRAPDDFRRVSDHCPVTAE
jgi:endonuclease/exonuclease/phosphatase family metal-dependent hydrolase